MKITAIKTAPIRTGDDTIVSFFQKYLHDIQERSIFVVTSKIVSLCEGRVIKVGSIPKDQLMRREADWYLPREKNFYNIMLAIKNSMLIPSAGIDESNGDGHFVLWPSNPQKSANLIRHYLKERFNLKEIGVIITDSTTAPLRRGTNGVAIAHSGFLALKNYIGEPDIFGQLLKITRANIKDALAAAAVAVMGEGNEQTPIAIIEDLPFVEFQDRDPIMAEVQDLHIGLSEDLYAPLLKSVCWRPGGQRVRWYNGIAYWLKKLF